MKFLIEKRVIFKSLSHLQSIVDKKNTLPILSNILLEAKNNELTMCSTDMDISIKETLNCNVVEEGSTTINAQMIYDIIKKLDDAAQIEIIANDGKILTLRSGVSKFSLACLPKEEYPLIESKIEGSRITTNAENIFKLIDKTRFAISNEETRYFLNGLYFSIGDENGKSIITIVGTDGHRLAKFSIESSSISKDINGVIIPKKTINELYKLLSEKKDEIEIEIDSNKIIFYINKLVLISKLIDGTFPDYKRVIPKNNNQILIINRLSLLAAVDRVSTIVNEKSPVIKFRILENLVNLSTYNNDNSSATEDLIAKFQGDKIEIGFNAKYIMDILDNLKDDEITISLMDSSSPIIASEKSNPDLVYVLMPMRV
tara:strand:+ start:4166 stop:5281 length:1116 start_codon:yes stop_codon:yes gene_type:complete